VAFAAGWLVARILRTDRSEETALLFGLGMNNNGTGLVLAGAVLADRPQVTTMIVCYNLIQHLVAGSVDYLRGRQQQEIAETEPTGEVRSWREWRQWLVPALRPFLTFGYTLAAGVILASACGLYWNVRTLANTNRWVIHTYQVRKEGTFPCPATPTLIPDEPPGLSRRSSRRDKPGGSSAEGSKTAPNPNLAWVDQGIGARGDS